MKKIKHIFFLLLVLNLACTSTSAPDCFQAAGDISREEVTLADFNKITVFENIELILKEGEQKVEIETGEFLREEVTAVVEDGRLVLRDENDCNFVRDYGVTKIYVTAPNIKEIRSSTSWPIRSEGILSYNSLTLLSESYGEPEAETTDGEFILTLNANSISVVVNGNSYFKLSGSTKNLNVMIAAGDSRIETENLMAKSIIFNHRGSNDLLIHPEETLTGVLRGTGDVRSFNKPPSVSVETLYTGKLIFED
ncbi:head GIN domain-containing protein [Maribacter sp.]|uniref:head GIN domain-containing protein n=1 Tax=Maribacter sp. TaxID=1897614 RepID=UPI0025C075B8|nr:head GIN domain-containing protein [Maribacter sp.]